MKTSMAIAAIKTLLAKKKNLRCECIYLDNGDIDELCEYHIVDNAIDEICESIEEQYEWVAGMTHLPRLMNTPIVNKGFQSPKKQARKNLMGLLIFIGGMLT